MYMYAHVTCALGKYESAFLECLTGRSSNGPSMESQLHIPYIATTKLMQHSSNLKFPVSCTVLLLNFYKTMCLCTACMVLKTPGGEKLEHGSYNCAV